MKVERIEIDSKVLGGNVLAISDFDPATEFAEFERRYVEEFRPIYVSCKIPLERISEIQILESQGFGLIEGQIRSLVKLRKMHDISRFPSRFRTSHQRRGSDQRPGDSRNNIYAQIVSQ